MSEVSMYENWTEIFDRKLDSLINANEKIINFCEKNAEEINYLHKKIDELSKDNSVEEDKDLKPKKSKSLFDNPITEEELLLNINTGIFNPRLEGKEVILKEGEDDAHIWVIIRVNSNSYDLWYKDSIGTAMWRGSDHNRYWTSNDPTDASNPRGLCTKYKSKLSSSIQAKLKTGLNVNCGDDLVVILSESQLGGVGYTIANNDNNIPILYFNSDSRRAIGSMYWTSSVDSLYSNSIWNVKSDGTFDSSNYHYNRGVVPAIRLGK